MKRFIITDPCYLISDLEAWDCLCDIIQDIGMAEAEKFLTQYLATPVRLADTGYGDWSNEIVSGKNVIKPDFFADAGLVCVLELTPLVDKMHKSKFDYLISDNPCGVAVIEAEGLADVKFDTSDSRWTVVTIIDTDGNIYRSSTYNGHFGIEDDK